ncbi:MAG: AEC family transporter [Peptococcaceae bacterium]|jgi:predicted permease|nr:AEC family transporter [Peptococcaceae bacterium]
MFVIMAESQAVLLLYILTGVLIRRLKLLDGPRIQGFMQFVLYVTLPCTIFNSTDLDFSAERLRAAWWTLILSLLITGLSILLGWLLFRRQDKSGEDKIIRFGLMCSNSTFAGIPLLSYAFGQEAVFYASIFIAPARILLWSAGVSLLTALPLKSKVKNMFLNPATIALAIGFIRLLSGVHLHPVLTTALRGIGDLTAPLSMITVGGILAEVNFSEVVEKRTLLFSFLRLVVLPGLVLLALKPLVRDDLILAVCVILTAMPAGTMTALLARKYQANDAFASKCITVSTVLSLVTVPLLAYFL